MLSPAVSRHNEGQRAYFMRADQPTMAPEESPYNRRHFQRLLDAARLGSGSRVLEIGAGRGRFTRMLADAGCDVVASDISEGQIDALKAAFPGIATLVAGAETLPEPDRPYDAVVGFFALHHLPDLRAAFARFARVLRPGGIVAFCEPNAFYVPFYVQILLTPRMRWSVEKGTLLMRPGTIAPAMKAAGFSDVTFTRYGFFPPMLHNRALGRRVETSLEALPIPDVTRAFQIAVGRRG